ncbi:MAG: hypothetical protein HKM93_13150 [Desulfobacteraceae bacterium]|nr:hypothetical protein [Desulfobacteraceae bacterium]
MASYPRQIPAGGTGTITIKVNTSNRGGGVLTKRITIETNDPTRKTHVLTITGMVDAFAEIQPKHARLFGAAGKVAKVDVVIKPGKKNPFKILNVRAQSGTHIKYTLSEPGSADDNVYVLTIENIKKDKGRYSDTILLTTDSELNKELRVPVFGNVREAAQGS